MLKIAQKSIKKLDFFFKSLVITLTLFFNCTNIAYGANNNWIEVSRTPEGIQYMDKYSINKIDKDVIEIKTKYLKKNINLTKEIEETIYTMRINCLTNIFKDISVNGKKNFSAKWEGTNGDKLIEDVITDGCKMLKLTNYNNYKKHA
tara:strand:+ start:88 stop:528 length:441 start_codon:yes stop_codon:yes gene_type:complete